MALSKLEISQLLGTYSALLTDKQRAALKLYCDCDCSLSEIADELGISRQGVRDAIVKGEKTLTRFEEALHLSKFTAACARALAENDMQAVVTTVNNFVVKE